MKRVVLLDAQIKRYRVPFFEQLATALREHEISFVVGYGAPAPADLERADTIDLPASLGKKLPTLSAGRITLQWVWSLVRDADLVIIGQANGLLANYALIALSMLGRKRVAYWGHGYNHQATHVGASEWLKRALIDRTDGWFAYTPEVERYLVRHGVAAAKITTFFNTTDIARLRADIARRPRGRGHTAIFCGALVPEKQLGFLVEAATEIRRLVPDFELVIVGAGRERARIAGSFIHVVGPAFEDRGRHFALGDVCLLPAYAGLAICDAFAAGLPVVTTTHPGHGPELDYLTPENSVTTAFDVNAYARAVADLLLDPARLAAMKSAALATGDQLPMSRMVEAFVAGIVRCLA